MKWVQLGVEMGVETLESEMQASSWPRVLSENLYALW